MRKEYIIAHIAKNENAIEFVEKIIGGWSLGRLHETQIPINL